MKNLLLLLKRVWGRDKGREEDRGRSSRERGKRGFGAREGGHGYLYEEESSTEEEEEAIG